MNLSRTYTITVVKPCDCVNCAAGKRWFFCVSDEPIVAKYEVTQDMVLQPEQIAHVWAQHPGMTLIY
jgi:hypothetical protein